MKLLPLSIFVIAISSFATQARATTYYSAASVKMQFPAGAASPVPVIERSINNVGGANSVSKTGPGNYDFSFGAMWSPTLPRTVQVVAEEGPAVCSTPSDGQGQFNALVVRVTCYAANSGQFMDTGFNIVFRMDSALNGDDAGYVRTTGGGTSVFHSWSSRGGVNTVSHPDTGHYLFKFGAINQTVSGGTVSVTTRTNGAKCAVSIWLTDSSGTTVTVRCVKASTTLGLAKDANLSVYFGRRPMISQGGWGFAWADQESTGSYTPDLYYQGISSGQRVTINRRTVGSYVINFPGLPAGAAGSFIVVVRSPAANPNINCSASSEVGIAQVYCNQNGVSIDTPFVVSFMAP